MNRIILIILLVTSLAMPADTAAYAMGDRPTAAPTPDTPGALRTINTMTYSLDECYQLALKQSEAIAIRLASTSEANADYFTATSQVIGDADFIMTHTWQEDQDSSDTTMARLNRGRKFSFKQPLFQGFKMIAAFKAAGAYTQQRKHEWIRAKQTLYSDVATAYFQALMYQREVTINKGTANVFKKRLKELTRRELLGRSKKSEIKTTEANLRSIEADLESSRGALRDAEEMLCYLTGRDITIDQLVDTGEPAVALQAREDYASFAVTRPDVVAAWQSMKAYQSAVIDAQSGLWPQATLEANTYERREGALSGIDYDALVKIDIPLSRGGETIGKIRKARAQYKKAKLNFEMAERLAELEIKKDYNDLYTSLMQYEALKAALQAAKENFLLLSDDYRHNLVSNIDVIDAVNLLNQNKKKCNQALYTLLINQKSFDVTLGKNYDNL